MALVVLPLLATAAPAAAQSSSSGTVTRSTLNARSLGYTFYLTDLSYEATQAGSACASGFHMASMWEIVDPSNLTYAFAHPAARTRDDSGAAPPSGWYAWVRTGGPASGSSTPGEGNCSAWTSGSAGSSGTILRIVPSWASPAVIGGVWDAKAWSCGSIAPVWCLSDLPAGIFVDGFETDGTTAWSAVVP